MVTVNDLLELRRIKSMEIVAPRPKLIIHLPPHPPHQQRRHHQQQQMYT